MFHSSEHLLGWISFHTCSFFFVFCYMHTDGILMSCLPLVTDFTFAFLETWMSASWRLSKQTVLVELQFINIRENKVQDLFFPFLYPPTLSICGSKTDQTDECAGGLCGFHRSFFCRAVAARLLLGFNFILVSSLWTKSWWIPHCWSSRFVAVGSY